MEPNELKELIQKARQNDRKAQEQLVLEVQDNVYYLCKKMLKHEDNAQDATQDVLISMLTKLDQLQEPGAFKGWVNAITYNRCNRMLSKGGREISVDEDEEGNTLLDFVEDLDEQAVPDKAIDNEETRRMIAQLVDNLPEAQRMTVLFYYYEEMSVRDIASIMGTNEGTVKSRLNYARKAIKEGVEGYEKEGVKLYGLSPLPLLLYFLRKDAAVNALPREAAIQLAASTAGVSASGMTGGTAAVTSAGTTTGAVSAGAATVASTAAKAGGTALGIKIAAAITAVAIAGGGATIYFAQQSSNPALEVVPSLEASQNIDIILQETQKPTETLINEEQNKEQSGEQNQEGKIEDPQFPVPVGYGNCDNSRVVSITFDDFGTQGTVSAGLGVKGTYDYLYLNLKCSMASVDDEVGFYVRPSRGWVEYDESRRGDRDTSANSEYANFLIVDRLYDDVVPSTYQSPDDYGLRWRDDVMIGGEFEDEFFLIRAVKLSTGEMLGIFRIPVLKDETTGIYSFGEMVNVNDEAMKKLPESVREDMLDQLLAYIPDRVWTNLANEDAEGWEETARMGAIFHCTNIPYFGRFLKSDSRRVGQWFHYIECQDLVILTVPVNGYDYLSAYFAPQAELDKKEFSLADTPVEEWNYTLFAYDPPMPRSKEMLAAPSIFWDSDF